MPKKAIVLRHMQERRDDHVAQFLNREQVEQLHVNPAYGVPLPTDSSDYDILVIYGGVQSANDGNDKPYIADELDWISNWLDSGRPALGICLGAQLIAKCLGARVAPHPDGIKEIGFHRLEPAATSNGFLERPAYFYQWHGEGFTVPDHCELLVEGEQFPNQAFRYRSNTYGLQFHPEVSRAVMESWHANSNGNPPEPGAHSEQRQLEDESRYGEFMGQWCWNFMHNWSKTW